MNPLGSRSSLGVKFPKQFQAIRARESVHQARDGNTNTSVSNAADAEGRRQRLDSGCYVKVRVGVHHQNPVCRSECHRLYLWLGEGSGGPRRGSSQSCCVPGPCGSFLPVTLTCMSTSPGEPGGVCLLSSYTITYFSKLWISIVGSLFSDFTTSLL